MTDIPKPKDLHSGFVTGWKLINQRERIHGMFLGFSIFINGILQTFALVGVVPFVQAAVDPSSLEGNGYLGRAREFLGNPSTDKFMLILAAGLLFMIVLKAAYGWMHLGWQNRFTARCEVRLSSTLMQRALEAPYAWLLEQNSVRLREIIFSYSVHWSRDFVRNILQLANDTFFTLLLLVVLIVADPFAGVIVGGIAGLLGAAAFFLVRPILLRIAIEKRRAVIAANVISTEAILGSKDIKVTGTERWFSNQFRNEVFTYASKDAVGRQWQQAPRFTLEMIAFSAIVIVSTLVTLSAQNTNIAGLLMLYALAALRLLPILNATITTLSNIVNVMPMMIEIQRMLDETAQLEHEPEGEPVALDWQEIAIQNVSYAYKRSPKLALQALSLEIERGKCYGLVGLSGGGKSTFIDVLIGLLVPDEGVINIDGVPLTENHRVGWRRHFAYVPQMPFMLDATLGENVIFGSDSPVDEEALRDALYWARLDDVVADLPDGLDSLMGERGVSLSGGQRQRVAIARALYRGANFLILDEATSALDAIVETEILESVKHLRGRVTIIIVTHRLGLIRRCDKIWLMDSGNLSDSGTHQDLFVRSNLYQRMISAQDYEQSEDRPELEYET
jgi:ABC-type multidrug transport system fused ATPase/permease subunit